MPKVKLFTRETGPDDPREVQVGYVFFCPGCKYRHEVHVYEPRSNGAQWGFNGDLNNPTFTIEHDEPFDIQLLGVFYSVEV